MDFVLKFARPEIERASHTMNIGLPATAVTGEALEQFRLENILREMEGHAPISLALLRGLINDKRLSPFEPEIPAVPVVASVVLRTWNRRANFLQGIFSLYFYSQGATKSLVSVLQRAGLSNSFDWIMEGLDHLTTAHLEKIQSILKDRKQPFMIVYDNINMAFRRYNQRTTNKDSFENGATATAILTSEMPAVEGVQDATRHIRASDLYPSKEQDSHLKETYRYHLIEALRRRGTISLKNPIPEPVKNKLKVERTKAYPLPSMHIDQSTVEGNRDILDKIMKVLQLSPETFFDQTRLVVAGDQLTLARIRSVARLRWDEDLAYYRVEWAIPVLQLFHLQMVLASTILKTHWGTRTTPGSLSSFVAALEKKRISPDKSSFHDLDEFLRHVFDAIVLLIWEIKLKSEEELSSKSSGQMPHSSMDVMDKVDGIIGQYLTATGLGGMANQQSVNAALFIRDMLFYIELGSAIKAGDIGRILEMIRWLTLTFQAGGNRNYANELLRLHCGLFYSWKTEDRNTILSSMLVNTTGQPNRWIPTDLYQEHNNLLTKIRHAAKSSNLNWGILEKKIAPNVRTFQEIARTVEKMFKTPHCGTNHSAPSSVADIDIIKQRCIEAGFFTHDDISPDLVVPAVRDLLAEGRNNIVDKRRIAVFKKCCGRYCNEDAGEMDVEMEEEEEDAEMDEERPTIADDEALEFPEFDISQFDLDEFVENNFC
ncbi:hypothetical protein EMPS_01711 [Entomortierella parvispora]|uniref:DUF6589 domain-containing protein n=1 Tax=Entomortierella parvispora TaxID=205924 RepID=A0A9P3H3K1_9FUNG|nr:hypothetical protein EMPS_01711 [Entomortierella parvispora]